VADWIERYWDKVDVRGADECWEWQASRHASGYGMFSRERTTTRAHRLAWELANGPIPDGLCVLHRCDNRSCCNPSHLFLGTIADNSRDMVEKGRAARGIKNGRAKLTRQDVRRIRQLYNTGNHTLAALGRQFGVTESNVCYIVNRERWTWVS